MQPRGPVQDHSWVMNSALTTVIGAQVLPSALPSSAHSCWPSVLCLVPNRASSAPGVIFQNKFKGSLTAFTVLASALVLCKEPRPTSSHASLVTVMSLGQEMELLWLAVTHVILWSWEGPGPLIHISEQKPLQVGY